MHFIKMTKNKLIIFFLLSNCFHAFAQIDTSETSFYRVYTKIFKVSCAMPACHDGTFEPDFRTPESAYNTTVYHPMIKNNTQGQFKYRIAPYDNVNSLLYERITNCCFVNINDRMPLTLGRDTLTHQKILLIANWINAGAKDITGNSPEIEVLPPTILKNYIVLIDDTSHLSDDHHARENEIVRVENKPFQSLVISPKTKFVKIGVKVKYDKENAAPRPLPLLCIGTSKSVSSSILKIQTKQDESYFIAELNPILFEKNKVYYMHIEIPDANNKKIQKYPCEQTQYDEKLYWSFVVRK